MSAYKYLLFYIIDKKTNWNKISVDWKVTFNSDVNEKKLRQADKLNLCKHHKLTFRVDSLRIISLLHF